MLRLSFLSFAVAIAVAACGGRVADEPATGDPTPAQGTTPPSPGSPVTNPPPGAPVGTAPRPPSTPATGPLPTGPTTSCGILDGDVEANLAAFGRARAIATYEVVAVIEECSGAGGLHITLKRRSGCASGGVVHFGEHACYTSTSWQVGDRAVVGVAPEAGSVNNPGWCLEGVAPWDGVARAMRKLAPSETEAQALSAYGCTL
jgi:hypothetical protein